MQIVVVAHRLQHVITIFIGGLGQDSYFRFKTENKCDLDSQMPDNNFK